jgi:hypothetical protein
MHLASNFPAKYYANALLVAAYLHNRTCYAGFSVSPYEIIYGVKPDLSRLVPFGCIGYYFEPIDKRSATGRLGKLEPSGIRYRMIGYSMTTILKSSKDGKF